jgi:hypothetical protein
MDCDRGFCIASVSGRCLSVGLLRIRGELAIGCIFVSQTSHEGRTVKALPSMWRGNLDRKPYCLIGDYPETSSVA